IELPAISYDRTAEQLTEGAGGPLSVMVTDGTVLFGPGPQPPPDVHLGDPDHPDRPTYSYSRAPADAQLGFPRPRPCTSATQASPSEEVRGMPAERFSTPSS